MRLPARPNSVRDTVRTAARPGTFGRLLWIRGTSKKDEECSQKHQYRSQLRRISHTFGHRHHLLQRGKRSFIECAARLPKFPGALQQNSQRYNKEDLRKNNHKVQKSTPGSSLSQFEGWMDHNRSFSCQGSVLPLRVRRLVSPVGGICDSACRTPTQIDATKKLLCSAKNLNLGHSRFNLVA